MLPATDAEAGALEPEPPQAASMEAPRHSARMIASVFFMFQTSHFLGACAAFTAPSECLPVPIMLYQFAQKLNERTCFLLHIIARLVQI